VESGLDDRILDVGSICIGSVAGVFRGHIWEGKEANNFNPGEYLARAAYNNRWRHNLPLLYRSSIFPTRGCLGPFSAARSVSTSDSPASLTMAARREFLKDRFATAASMTTWR
jgi:hypothetical protein